MDISTKIIGGYVDEYQILTTAIRQHFAANVFSQKITNIEYIEYINSLHFLLD